MHLGASIVAPGILEECSHLSEVLIREGGPGLDECATVAERSIVDNPVDGTTALRLGFSLSKSGNRAAPEPSDSPSSTVQSDGNKLTLRAVLHYLWDEAELTTWHPGFAGRRPWAVVHRRLRSAADGKLVRKNPLAVLGR